MEMCATAAIQNPDVSFLLWFTSRSKWKVIVQSEEWPNVQFNASLMGSHDLASLSKEEAVSSKLHGVSEATMQGMFSKHELESFEPVWLPANRRPNQSHWTHVRQTVSIFRCGQSRGNFRSTFCHQIVTPPGASAALCSYENQGPEAFAPCCQRT